MENKLKVEYVDIDTIKPYKNNIKLDGKIVYQCLKSKEWGLF